MLSFEHQSVKGDFLKHKNYIFWKNTEFCQINPFVQTCLAKKVYMYIPKVMQAVEPFFKTIVVTQVSRYMGWDCYVNFCIKARWCVCQIKAHNIKNPLPPPFRLRYRYVNLYSPRTFIFLMQYKSADRWEFTLCTEVWRFKTPDPAYLPPCVHSPTPVGFKFFYLPKLPDRSGETAAYRTCPNTLCSMYIATLCSMYICNWRFASIDSTRPL